MQNIDVIGFLDCIAERISSVVKNMENSQFSSDISSQVTTLDAIASEVTELHNDLCELEGRE